MKVKINGQILDATVQTRPSDTLWDGRASKAITMAMTYEDAVALFVNDLVWSVIGEAINEDGTTYEFETDMSEYAISGPITDNRDGTVTVRMGKYRDEELMRIPLTEVPADHATAVVWREIIEEAVQSIEDDAQALIAAPLYPVWGNLIGTEAKAGMRFTHDGDLYKVISAHVFAEQWVPGIGTESLYKRIDETHAGTQDDPIPYEGNMELTAGLYYAQDGIVYLCNRDTGAPVYNALKDLVGIYVEAVS